MNIEDVIKCDLTKKKYRVLHEYNNGECMEQ